jgi:hypothetical protein
MDYSRWFLTFLLCFSIQSIIAQNSLSTGKHSSQAFHDSIHWKPKKERHIHKYLSSLKAATQNSHATVFLGTWCSDSEKWVPRFMYLENIMGLKNVTYILLDENKSDPEGYGLQAGITHVPTFILFQDSIEVARIVETPTSDRLYLEMLGKLQVFSKDALRD